MFCEKCGSEMTNDSNVCEECEKKITAAVTPQLAPEPADKPPKAKLPLYEICIAIISVAVIYILWPLITDVMSIDL